MLYDLTYMGKLKQQKQKRQNENKLTDTEDE